MIRALLFIAVFLVSLPAWAEDGYVYYPAGCDFHVTLPGKPRAEERCHPVNKDDCRVYARYTKVFDLSATMNVYVACEETNAAAYQAMTEDSMRTALIAAAAHKLDTYQVDFQAQENSKIAILIGSGNSPQGQHDLLQTSLNTANKKSVMIVEGEIIGGAHEEADQMLSDILHSVTAGE